MGEGVVKLFIDECLSPMLAERANERGNCWAQHARDLGRLRDSDEQVLDHCVNEDRIIITANAEDFRKLVGRVELPPGLIILPAVGREQSWSLLEAALEHAASKGDARAVMLNHVIEVDKEANCAMYELPGAKS